MTLRRLSGALIAAAAAAACAPGTAPNTTPTPTAAALPSRLTPGRTVPEERFVDSILAQMTLAEKLGQLNQLSGEGDPTGPGGGERANRRELLRHGGIGSFLNVVGAD